MTFSYTQLLPKVSLRIDDFLAAKVLKSDLDSLDRIHESSFVPRSLDKGEKSSIVFAETPKHIRLAATGSPSILIIPESLRKLDILELFDKDSTKVLSTDDFAHTRVYLAQILLDRFRHHLDQLPNRIAKTAKIHPTASLGGGLEIGEGTEIGPFVVVESGAILSRDVKIGAGSFIGERCYVGQSVVLQPGARVGPNGFGFTSIKNQEGNPHPLRIPHTGTVVIEDFSEIGANSVVARATLEATIVGKRTKIDNLVHIAHNCTIGSDCMITAGFMTGGSTTIGDRVQIGGHCTVRDHIHIDQDIQLGGFSCVTESLTKPGPYNGYPARPLKESLKILASLKKLPDLVRRSQREQNSDSDDQRNDD